MCPRAPRTVQDRRPLRVGLGLLRLFLLFVLANGLLLQIGLQNRAVQEDGAGLNRVTPQSLDLPFFGTTVMLETSSVETQQAALARLQSHGVGWVRQRFDWGELEPSPGQYDWLASDDMLSVIDAAGLIPIVVLDGSPAWARALVDQPPTNNPHAPPADARHFARFAAAFARRYGEQLDYYQIWHEPNIAPHWGNRHIEPVQYAQLLIEASKAIRAADGDAVILTAALAPTVDQGHTAIDEVTYLRRLYASGVQPFVDAVAIEPFGFGASADDERQRVGGLNFQRAAWVRRAMLAAGDGETPLIAARSGWNRQPASPWRTVTPDDQRLFLVDALAIGWSEWPWLAGMGWVVDQPAFDDDPLWGFALDDALLMAVRNWHDTAPGSRTAAQTRFPWSIAVMIGALAVVIWRGWAAMRLLPWHRWRTGYQRWPVWGRMGVWATVIALYYVATWPPLILLWLAVAAILVAMQPHVGLWLAALLLPFTFQHKEVHGVNVTLLITPVQAVILASLPAMLLRMASARKRLNFWPLDWFGVVWLAVSLIAAMNVWHWPGYFDGLIDLVLTPLLVYTMLRIFAVERRHRVGTALWLFAGGVLVAAIGLGDWLQGGGTEADGIRRLVGPYFSPNHAALYLERTLFLGMGLWLARRQWPVHLPRPPKFWGDAGLLSASALVILALLLTGSRGALLLGVPAGLALFVWLTAGGRSRDFKWVAWAFVALLGVGAAAGIVFWPRLSNTSTLVERLSIWQATLSLWQETPLVGVGPGGFYWHFPAFIPAGAMLDPNLRHPHNIWLEMGAMWGIAGLIWLASLLIWAAHRCWIERTHLWRVVDGGIAIGLLAGIVAGLAHGQVDAFGVLADIAAWNWLALGLWRAFGQRRTNETQYFTNIHQ